MPNATAGFGYNAPAASRYVNAGHHDDQQLHACDRFEPALDFERHVLAHSRTPDRVLTKADLMAPAKGTN
jgi:hypothetical protein